MIFSLLVFGPLLYDFLKSQAVFTLFILIVGPLQRVRPRNGILALVVVVVVLVVPLRSEFIGEL